MCSAALAFARGGWEDPVGGWLYTYDANDGEDAYVPAHWQLGCLDGEWVRGNSSDVWDGSAPGDTTDPAAVPRRAPGGVGILELPGEGEGGGAASVLSFEDIGDPRNAIAPFPAFPETNAHELGSNRKIFLVKDLTGLVSLADGITLCARFRLNPDPVDVNCNLCPDEGNGFALNGDTDNKGMLGYAERDVATLNFAIDDLQQLRFFDNESAAGTYALGSGTDWVTLWMAAKVTDPAVSVTELTVSVYLNGAPDPLPDWEEAIFTETNRNFEGGANNPGDMFISAACGSTGYDGAWQLDYICIASGYHLPVPPVTGCPGGLACAADPATNDVNLTWDNRGTPVQSFKIERNGTELEAAYAGSNTTYKDAGVAPGSYDYTVTPTVTGKTCDPMTCSASLCPRALTCVVSGSSVTLSWTNEGSYAGLVVKRDGTQIASLGGTEQTYTDTLTAAQGKEFIYTVAPTTGTCELSCTAFAAPPLPAEVADFGPPEGGWGYVYDPAPGDPVEEVLQYEPDGTLLGCLDGTWRRHNGSDRWDGTAPGEVDDVTDVNPADGLLDGAAPGGIGLMTLANGGPAGTAAAVLSIEDVGNPFEGANFQWNGQPLRWADNVDPLIEDSGSNRKIYLGHPFNDLASDPVVPECLLDDGLTLNVRLRLTPPEQVVDFDAAGVTAPDGMPPQADSKGLVTLQFLPAVETADDPVRILSVTLWGAGGSYYLQINTGEPANVMQIYLGGTVADATKFINLWLTIERPGDELIYRVTAYMNGVLTPFATRDIALPNNNDETESGTGNVIMMGSKNTDEVCAFQLDFLKLAAGANPPTEPSTTMINVFVGDANNDRSINIADAVFLLGYLFSGAKAPDCKKAADANDDKSLNIADAVTILGYLFSGGTMTLPDGTVVRSAQHPGCAGFEQDDVNEFLTGCNVPCTKGP
jgi:hypothetical protein